MKPIPESISKLWIIFDGDWVDHPAHLQKWWSSFPPRLRLSDSLRFKVLRDESGKCFLSEALSAEKLDWIICQTQVWLLFCQAGLWEKCIKIKDVPQVNSQDNRLVAVKRERRIKFDSRFLQCNGHQLKLLNAVALGGGALKSFWKEQKSYWFSICRRDFYSIGWTVWPGSEMSIEPIELQIIVVLET